MTKTLCDMGILHTPGRAAERNIGPAAGAQYFILLYHKKEPASIAFPGEAELFR